MSIFKDRVMCCNCGFIGDVEQGSDVCPNCKKEGTLKDDNDLKGDYHERKD